MSLVPFMIGNNLPSMPKEQPLGTKLGFPTVVLRASVCVGISLVLHNLAQKLLHDLPEATQLQCVKCFTLNLHGV